MTTFSESATHFIDAEDDAARRRELWNHFSEMGLPTTEDEVWRYAPLKELHLDQFEVSQPSMNFELPSEIDDLARDAALVIHVENGHLRDVGPSLDGVKVSSESPGQSLGDNSYFERYESDAFALLNGALCPGTITIRIAAGHHVAGPIVIVQSFSAGASWPSIHINVERGASVSLIECLLGGGDAVVVPLSQYEVGDNAELSISTYQRLAPSAWHIARSTVVLHRDARMNQGVVGLGGHYNRSRNDAEFVGSGSLNRLHTTFLGSGNQVHDFRTHQHHLVGRTNSVLLSKGAVADESRSVYTGLIEIEKGARRSDARQTNVNLLLSKSAHADTVPNLDIKENDVVCAHASSVGPLDEMQRWYLESRGVDRDVAERLMVQGFFNEMTDAMPPSVAAMVDRDVARVLAASRVVSA
jgi:Fe-S cluster assembly protein SufD